MTAAKAKQEIAKVETQVPAIAPDSEASAVLSMIERAARDPNVDIDKMQRLMDMKREVEAQRAERDFNDKMALAQADMRPVAADATNPQTRSKYASYAALDRALRPVYTKHGFALSFNMGDGAPADHVRVLCDVTNCGHTRHYKIDMPSDGKGAKGGDVMTKTHATGSAASYGMRYLLKMIFNMAVGEADDDGNAASSPTITDEQCTRLMKRLDDVGADKERFCKAFKIAGVAMLAQKDYARANELLDKKAESQV